MRRKIRGPLESKELKCLLIITVFLFSTIASLNMVSMDVQASGTHIVAGTVYEANGTLLPGANVTIRNVRTGESSNATTNATAVYSYNLLSWISGWEVGDTIQVNTTNSTGVNGINSTQILIGTNTTIIDIWIGTNISLSGIYFYVIDENGQDVSDAYINIKDNSGDIVTTKLTDTYGKASTSLSDGVYTITVSKSGHEDTVKKIRVHGMDRYFFLMGDKEESAETTDFWSWIMIILVVFFLIGVLSYIVKKV